MAIDNKAYVEMLEAKAKAAEAKAAAAEARAAEAEAKAAAVQQITVKVGPKGTICVYGLGRNPVSLYPSQWTALRNDRDALAAVDRLVALSKSDPRAFEIRALEARDRAEQREAAKTHRS